MNKGGQREVKGRDWDWLVDEGAHYNHTPRLPALNQGAHHHRMFALPLLLLLCAYYAYYHR